MESFYTTILKGGSALLKDTEKSVNTNQAPVYVNTTSNNYLRTNHGHLMKRTQSC